MPGLKQKEGGKKHRAVIERAPQTYLDHQEYLR